MDSMISVAQLRKLGFKVRVSHKRITEQDNLAKYRDVNKDQVLPCGGETEVEIVNTRTHKTYIGKSRCKFTDNYSKKIGTKFALERALIACLCEGHAYDNTIDVKSTKKEKDKKKNKKKKND